MPASTHLIAIFQFVYNLTTHIFVWKKIRKKKSNIVTFTFHFLIILEENKFSSVVPTQTHTHTSRTHWMFLHIFLLFYIFGSVNSIQGCLKSSKTQIGKQSSVTQWRHELFVASKWFCAFGGINKAWFIKSCWKLAKPPLPNFQIEAGTETSTACREFRQNNFFTTIVINVVWALLR